MMGVLSTDMLLEGQSNYLCVLFCEAVELHLNEGQRGGLILFIWGSEARMKFLSCFNSVNAFSHLDKYKGPMPWFMFKNCIALPNAHCNRGSVTINVEGGVQIEFQGIQPVFQASITMRLDVSKWSYLGQILFAADLFCFCSV